MFSSSETSLKTDSIKPITSLKVVDAKYASEADGGFKVNYGTISEDITQ